LLLCTYTGRFVYPLLSLEGRKFWILGLLPLDRGQLLWGKFVFSTTMTLSLAEVLSVLSDLMLGMPWPAVVMHALAMLVLAAGVAWAGGGAERAARRDRRVAAELPRDRPVEDRGRLWRHVQPGGGSRVPDGDGAADGRPVAPVRRGQRRPSGSAGVRRRGARR